MELEPLNYAPPKARPARRFPLWSELTVLTVLLIVFGYLLYGYLGWLMVALFGFVIQQN